MKRLFLILACIINGCAAHTDSAGNVSDYALSPSQASQVAQSVASELARRYPARTLISFPHDNRDTFPVALERAVRVTGMGITAEEVPGYHRLRYRLLRLNAHQFFIVVSVNQRTFDLIWSDDDGELARMNTITQFGGPDE